MISRRQIKDAITVLSQACDEDFEGLKKEIQESISIAQSIIDESEKKIKALSQDQGKSQSLFGFTEQYVKDLKHNHSDAISSFITNWSQRQSDWRFPWCLICANDIKYAELSIKSHLVYVCANHVSEKMIKQYVIEKYNKANTTDPRMFRVKPLEFTGHINDADVPYNQIGTLLCIDFLPYLSLEQIQNLFASIHNVLRPGGQALLHFSDGDGLSEWQSVIDHKTTFLNQSTIKDFAESVDLQTSFYHVQDFYSFVVLTKSGNKTSIKTGLTKIEPFSSTK